jgi:type IV pilus assembly protein PilC
MPLFAVHAFTAESRSVRKNVQAASREAALLAIRKEGLFPATVTERRSIFAQSHRLKLSRQELSDLFTHMEMQLGAGVQVVQAVASLKDSLPSPNLRYVLREVYDALTTSSADLTNAFRLFPRSFPPDILTVIEAGESTASLPDRFAELRERVEFTTEVRRSITRALQYPSFVFLLGSGIIVFFMGRIVPQLSVLLKDLNAPLPRFTRIVIGVADEFQTLWPYLLATITLVPVLYLLARRWRPFAFVIDSFLLRAGPFGTIYSYLSAALIARIFRSLYLSRKAGFEQENLELCSTLVTNVALSANLRRMKRFIADGDQLSTAFSRANVFPPEACSILASGEATGHLDTALERISDFYSKEGRRRITGMTAWIGPVTIIIIGAFVGSVIIALFLPFFNLIKLIR